MKNDITYQNKDVLSKIFASEFGERSFEAYGLSVPRILRTMPTNLPEVRANELRLDCMFEFVDGSYGIVDYESKYKEENWLKYVNYTVRVLEQLRRKTGSIRHNVRIIVLYTGNVERKSVPSRFKAGNMDVIIEPAFLSELDAEEIEKRLTEKVENGLDLSETDRMHFIVLPLVYKKKDDQKKALERSFMLVKKIKDEEAMKFILAGLLVFSDKIIDEKMSQKMRRWLMMTKVERIFEKEKEEAVRKVQREKDKLEQEMSRVQEENSRIQEESSRIQEESSRIQEESTKIQEEISRIRMEKDESMLNAVRAMMSTLKITAQAAMDTMKISPEDRKKYMAML